MTTGYDKQVLLSDRLDIGVLLTDCLLQLQSGNGSQSSSIGDELDGRRAIQWAIPIGILGRVVLRNPKLRCSRNTSLTAGDRNTVRHNSSFRSMGCRCKRELLKTALVQILVCIVGRF